jgi:hypothetical protein
MSDMDIIKCAEDVHLAPSPTIKRIPRNSRGPTSCGLTRGSKAQSISLDPVLKPREVESSLFEHSTKIPEQRIKPIIRSGSSAKQWPLADASYPLLIAYLAGLRKLNAIFYLIDVIEQNEQEKRAFKFLCDHNYLFFLKATEQWNLVDKLFNTASVQENLIAKDHCCPNRYAFFSIVTRHQHGCLDDNDCIKVDVLEFEPRNQCVH